MPGSEGEIGAYVAKVLPGGAAEQTGKILEGEQRIHFLQPSCQMLERKGFVLHEKKRKKAVAFGNFPRVNENLEDLGAEGELQLNRVTPPHLTRLRADTSSG